MALDPLRIAPLPPGQAITNPQTGAPTVFFLDWLTALAQRLVIAVNSVNTAVETIQIAQDQLVSQQQQATTQAQAIAVAQATADATGGGPEQSGDALSVIALIPATGAWVPGPQVDFAGLAAGTVSAVNSGPSQTPTTTVGDDGSFLGHFRIVEIHGGETTIFTGTFIARRSFGGGSFTPGFTPFPAITLVFSTTDTTTFTAAAASTGTVSYRLDLNSPLVELTNVQAYLYIRRS